MNRPSDDDRKVIENTLAYIRIDGRDVAIDHLISLYERAYKKGFEEGKKEGRVKTKIVYNPIYDGENPYKWDGMDFEG